MYKTISFGSYASVNSSCGDFAHLVSLRGGALANLARPGTGAACFLNYFNKY